MAFKTINNQTPFLSYAFLSSLKKLLFQDVTRMSASYYVKMFVHRYMYTHAPCDLLSRVHKDECRHIYVYIYIYVAIKILAVLLFLCP